MDPIIPQPEQPQYSTPELVSPHKHFLNKKFVITFVILILLGAGAYAGIWYWGNQQLPQEVVPTFMPRIISEEYRNNQYGFSIALPDSWKGYAEGVSSWEGRDVISGKVVDVGPIITFTDPLWTKENPREVMPVMIFTLAQWALVQSEKMSVSAAPIPPSVLGQNSKYVIALPARYNYDFKTGWEEVDQLVHTLKTFESTPSTFCGGIAGVTCPSGYSCKLDGTYPDAGGTCVQNSNTGTLTGHVTIGPNCPVEQVGNPCTPAPEAYTSRQVIVYAPTYGATVKAKQNLDVYGNYSINLSPGTYYVTVQPAGTGPQPIFDAKIIKGQTTTMNFIIDTGIR